MSRSEKHNPAPVLDLDSEESDEMTAAVCLDSDLQDGQMMEVEVGRHGVLLARCNGEFTVLGNQCTHYGAPLSRGALMGHKLRCPWHGSCFNVKTGDLEEYPGIDCLPKHKVKVENSKVYVTINKKSLHQTNRMKEMGGRVAGVSHTTLLLGGGPACLMCAETLRQERYGGRIIMVTRDDLLPYDKTRLSKVMDVENNSITLRREEFFQQFDIEVWFNKQVTSVNTEEKNVAFSDGGFQHYDQLLIATGCRAKGLDCPGADLDNVLMLETPADARRIHSACKDSRIVVVGTSFVGMEVASYMTDKAATITVIGSSELPYQRTLGPEIGKITMMMLAERGVKFYMNDSVKEVRREDKRVKEVVLKSGTVLPADVLIVGIGVLPNSGFLQGSGINMDNKKYVPVDKFMRTNVADVFCAGDLSSFPLKMAGQERVNIGHWQIAQAHGRVVALNMLHKQVELNSAPFYWTVLVGRTIRYTGYGEGYTELILKGKFEDLKFLALYIKGEEVVAAAGLNFDPAVSVVAERFSSGKVITRAEAESDDLSWLKLPTVEDQ
ncbi:apoptosis-inducing factor 3 [Denticeps clupeoides]|uniref:apoptosis-inducing factor 3 n=1 Tax=Denticeps clupeoides TaxID=299321 RepID=UPI0010A45EF4|nr:apoptosis-inducing factor 3-like [Denticeps clupeoides]